MLKGKNAIITGARRGIGRATVEVFAENGANIWACARREDAAFEADMAGLAEKYGVWIEPVYFDLTDTVQMKQAVKQIQSAKKPVDILVNNAGAIADSTSFTMTSLEKMKEIFDVNFFSQMQLTQYVARFMMRQQSGSIVNLTSVAALDGEPGQLEYVGSKAALVGATRKLARELADLNIRVNTVAPGMVDTDMAKQADPVYWEELIGRTFLKRAARPEEIANSIAFLASDKASYITGQTIRVDGGI